MSDGKDMIDPSPTSPAEHLEAQKKRIEYYTKEFFQRESAMISVQLKTTGDRRFKIAAPHHDCSLMPAVAKASEMISAHFEKSGWEVSTDKDFSFCAYYLDFNLPGTRAKKRRTLATIGIVVALVVAAVGGIFAYPYAKAKFSGGAVSSQQENSELIALIAKSDFSFVDKNLVAVNFPDDGVRTDFKLYQFDRDISSKEVIKEMAKDGYLPANFRELLNYTERQWNGKDLVLAIGQTWQDDYGRCRVQFAWSDDDGRMLGVAFYGEVWNSHIRFLAVRENSPEAPR